MFVGETILAHHADPDGLPVHSIAGIEVKAAATANEGDFRGLRKLREAAGTKFVAGVVLYDGSATIQFGDSLFAVPIRTLWEAP